MRLHRSLLLLGLVGWLALHATPVPHPDRPDRLVETRDGRSVEYSPGQEAWMEMAFVRMQVESSAGSAAPVAVRPPGPAAPGSARYLHENREVILASIARQIGLERATSLQGRAFDTFLGYYDLIAELMQVLARELPSTLTVRHLAIWQRDDLVQRLRAGAKIEGLSYDAAKDSGRFDYNRSFETPALKERFAAIFATIDQQRVKHTFKYDPTTASASFSLTPPPPKPVIAAADSAAIAAPGSDPVIPIIYRGDLATPPREAEFSLMGVHLATFAAAAAEQAASYRNPTIVGIILHETAEIGLLEKIIVSADRRWLCDGTANYAAWRVTRDLLGPDFANQVYSLDNQLRQYAAQQPAIDLVRWSAVENEKEGQAETELNRAHYAFATRVMFLLAEHHGENALAQLWADVAQTPQKKVTSKTFANAYRKRFKSDLGKLINEAQQKPISPVPAPPKPKT